MILYQDIEEYARAAECISHVAENKHVLVTTRKFNRQQFVSNYPVSFSPNAFLNNPPNAIVLLMEWSEATTSGRLKLLKALRDAYPEWRIASMPGVGIGELAYCNYDISDVRERCEQVFAILARAKIAQLATENPSGDIDTLTIPLSDQLPTCSTGRVAMGTWGNFPSGETFALPKSYRASGWVTVRGSIPNYPLPPESWVRFEVRRGRVRFRSLHASSSELLERARHLFFSQSGRVKSKNANSLAELGIGTNPAIKALTGNPVFDEKKIDTVHLGFGGNDQFAGPIKSLVHHDIVCTGTTLTTPGRNGPMAVVNEHGFCLKPAHAMPVVGQFPALSENLKLSRSSSMVPMVYCEPQELMVEYCSERGTTKFQIGDSEASSITKELFRALNNRIAVDASVLIETMEKQGISPELCKRILCGLIEYRILRKARNND